MPSSHKGFSLKRRDIEELVVAADEYHEERVEPLRPIPPTPHELVRQTFAEARELVPPGLPPIARYFATVAIFMGRL